MVELRANNIDPKKFPIAIDCDASQCRFYVDTAPCLTAARGKSSGCWITCKGRKMKLAELFALQGMDVAELKLPANLSPAKLGFMVGNAFTQTTVERILGKLLVKAGIVDQVQDRWM
jgi:hypothetical protein